ncbi:MAG: hypothetical protein ACE5MB_06560 [Anaerolineae bacterium]
MQTGEGRGMVFLGRLLSLQVQPAQRVTWLGAAWAALCGAVASGKLTLSGQNLLSLGLALFLADPLLGAVWSALATLSRSAGSSRGEVHSSEASVQLPPLPYTQPGSASEGFFARLNASLTWWRAELWPRAGGALVGLVVASALALAMGVILGPWVALLVSAALVFPLLAALFGHRPLRGPLPRALLEMGLAWLLGYAAFQDLSFVRGEDVLASPLWASVLAWLGLHREPLLLAGLYTAVYYACLTLEGRGGLAQPLALLNGAQLAVAVILVVIRQPVLAGLVGMLLISQALFQPLLRRQGPHWYLQRTQFFLMGAMLAAALGVAIRELR